MANTTPPTYPVDLPSEPYKMAAEIAEQPNDFKNKASDYNRKANDAIDEKRMAAASSLDRAAATLHHKADHLPGVDTLSGMAHNAAEKLSATAEYVRKHDVRGVMSDIGAVVKRNPGPSLLAAAMAGFLLGRKFSGGARC